MSSDTTMPNAFGSITISDAADTLTLIEFPVQKGQSTLDIVADDYDDSVLVNPAAKTIVPVQSDSVVTVVSDTAEVEKPSVFAEFDEQVLRINYMKVGDIENGWMFWVLLPCLVLYSVIKLVFHKKTRQVFSLITNYNLGEKEFDKSWDRSQLTTVVFQFLFAINAGLFILFAVKTYSHLATTVLQDVSLFALLTLCVLVLYMLKKLVFYTLATVFDRVKYARECVFTVYLFNHALGVCLFPIVLSLAYISPSVLQPKTLLVIGYVVVGLIFLLRMYREFQISNKNGISFIYIFLYFCALELLPLFVIAKIVSSIISSDINII